MLDENAFFM